ncbi:hypothetical protein Tco_0283556, partial [Tanacetum coccineum]
TEHELELKEKLRVKYDAQGVLLKEKDVDKCTDISKITRKPSKTSKHGHEKRKNTREAKDSKLKPKKVNFSQLQSTMGQQKSTH